MKRSLKQSRHNTATLKKLKKKLDSVAVEQLRREVVSLSTQLEESEIARIYAEENADFWHDQVTSLDEQITEANCSLGIRKNGEMVLVQH